MRAAPAGAGGVGAALVEGWPLRAAPAAPGAPRRDRATPDSALRRTAERVEAVDSEVHAFVPLRWRLRRLMGSQVGDLTRWVGHPKPPLWGTTVGVKDIIRVDGLPTRAGSEVPADVLEGPQATVVDRLRAAGAVVAGKTHTAEFASSAPGPTRNPHDLRHTPGGSSSGSAAAVAAGMVPLAIGTQTIGSVIRPAAYCGVVGFVPTWGRIPVDGVIANAPSLDRVGTFTTDVAGAVVAAAVLVDGWQGGSAVGSAVPVPARRPVLGVPVGAYLDLTEPPARERFDNTVAALRAAGFDVRTVPVLADVERVVGALTTVNRYEIARVHTAWFAAYAGLYRDETAATIRAGQRLTAADHAAGRAVLDAARDALARAMDTTGLDLWIAPAARGPAPLGLGSTGDPVIDLPWSAAGMPAVTLPAGRVDGLPVGIQCIGRCDGDEELLAAAALVQEALGAAGGAPDRADT